MTEQMPEFEKLNLQLFSFQSDTLDRYGQVTRREDHHARRFIQPLPGKVPLPMVALPGGLFQMGSPRGQGYDDETPRHPAAVRPFLMGQAPINQRQWQAVMGKQPNCRFQSPDLPVERVSWLAAQGFCQKLSQITGRKFRLPSEVQWEYACRAGSAAPFSTGETITTEYANYCGDHTFREEPPGLYRHTTTPADAFPPNLWGLQDMHGNLWEYCADAWHPHYSGAPFDDDPWIWSGEPGWRAARGGSWHEPPINCRCAARLRVNEQESDDLIGLRVVMLL